MTISSEDNRAAYTGDGVLVAFSYAYRADNDGDIFVFLDTVEQEGGYTIARNPDNQGGLVTFDLAPAIRVSVVLLRKVPLTQEVDYTPYDAFPEQTHEGALDKLTMAIQQVSNDGGGVIRIPEAESGSVNTTVPSIPNRADQFLYFDHEGNVTTVEAEIDVPAVYRIDVQDGSNGEDSRDLLHIETASGGASYPKIGFKNINKPNGPVQLTDTGVLPPGLINIVGIQIRGPFRGDDLCPKPGDDPVLCNEPDTRNPSERYPEIIDALSSGDTFIITMADGEVTGTMNLFSNVGDVTPAIVSVNGRDGIIFLRELRNPDTDEVLIYEGWYLYPKLAEVGDASFISYNSAGNLYVTGTNVQVALDAIDNHLQDRDEWHPNQLTPTREGLPATDANATFSGGFYQFNAGSNNLPNANAFHMIQMLKDNDNLVQMAMEEPTGTIYNRGRQGGVWSDWRTPGIPSGSVMLFYQANAPEGWEKIAELDNYMVRIVAGNSGGASGGSDSPILNNKIPSHNHPASSNTTGAHVHSRVGHNVFSGSGYPGLSGTGNAGTQQDSNSGGDHSHTITVNNNSGSNWTPKYINCILCRKL